MRRSIGPEILTQWRLSESETRLWFVALLTLVIVVMDGTFVLFVQANGEAQGVPRLVLYATIACCIGAAIAHVVSVVSKVPVFPVSALCMEIMAFTMYAAGSAVYPYDTVARYFVIIHLISVYLAISTLPTPARPHHTLSLLLSTPITCNILSWIFTTRTIAMNADHFDGAHTFHGLWPVIGALFPLTLMAQLAVVWRLQRGVGWSRELRALLALPVLTIMAIFTLIFSTIAVNDVDFLLLITNNTTLLLWTLHSLAAFFSQLVVSMIALHMFKPPVDDDDDDDDDEADDEENNCDTDDDDDEFLIEVKDDDAMISFGGADKKEAIDSAVEMSENDSVTTTTTTMTTNTSSSSGRNFPIALSCAAPFMFTLLTLFLLPHMEICRIARLVSLCCLMLTVLALVLSVARIVVGDSAAFTRWLLGMSVVLGSLGFMTMCPKHFDHNTALGLHVAVPMFLSSLFIAVFAHRNLTDDRRQSSRISCAGRTVTYLLAVVLLLSLLFLPSVSRVVYEISGRNLSSVL